MSREFNDRVRRELVDAIITNRRDPATWLLALREIIELTELSLARCLVLPATLDSACFALVDEARKQDRVGQLAVALGLWKARKEEP